MSVLTVADLELLLDTTPSPNTLLRPQFWKMGLQKFCSAFHTQFISSGSADEVFPSVWVGNKHAAENINYLKERGITHVLNCAGGQQVHADSFGHKGSGSVRPDQGKLDQACVKYKPLTLRDVPGENISEIFEEAVDWIDAALEEGGKILVNCFVGSSRSATVVIAFLLRHRKHSLKEAVVAVKKKRDVKPNEGFLQQLIEYEAVLGREKEQQGQS
eukprot:GFUD01020570.1.p1 GENE.GFUD01020570.1~~GFUD01020570.1.p1  ORF type:complete len:216 (+),score=66.98 GFUD01020570.1:92-739(+)